MSLSLLVAIVWIQSVCVSKSNTLSLSKKKRKISPHIAPILCMSEYDVYALNLDMVLGFFFFFSNLLFYILRFCTFWF